MAKIIEGKETYPSKAAQKKHEKTESKSKETSEEKAMSKGKAMPFKGKKK